METELKTIEEEIDIIEDINEEELENLDSTLELEEAYKSSAKSKNEEDDEEDDEEEMDDEEDEDEDEDENQMLDEVTNQEVFSAGESLKFSKSEITNLLQQALKKFNNHSKAKEQLLFIFKTIKYSKKDFSKFYSDFSALYNAVYDDLNYRTFRKIRSLLSVDENKNLNNESLEEANKPYVSGDWKGNYEIIDGNGKVYATFNKKNFGNDGAKAKAAAQADLKRNFKKYTSSMSEAEINTDEEFMEYAHNLLKKAHGDNYDKDKAEEAAKSILKKAKGDYGTAIGILTSGLGEELEESNLTNNTNMEEVTLEETELEEVTLEETELEEANLEETELEETNLEETNLEETNLEEIELEEANLEEANLEEISLGDAATLALGGVGAFAAISALVLGTAYVKYKLGQFGDYLVKKGEKIQLAKYYDKIESIATKFENDSKLHAMYKALPKYDHKTSNKTRNAQLKQIADYIKSKLNDDEKKVFIDISAALRKKYDKMESFELEESNYDIDTSDISRLVESEEGLTEEFKEKAVTLFEVALNQRVRELTTSLEEDYNQRLAEEVATIEENLVEKVDNYLTYAVETWVEENKVAIETALRSEISESFISAIKNVFVEHYIDVPESKKDIVNEMEEEINNLKNSITESTETINDLTSQLKSLSRDKVIAELTTNLADTQSAKIRELVEDIEYTDEDTFRKKVETVKEFYINGVNSTSEESEESADSSYMSTTTIVEESESVEDLSPSMKNYLTALSRLAKAKSANV